MSGGVEKVGHAMRKHVARIILAVLGVVVVAVVLLAVVPQVRAMFSGIAQFVPAVGPASGLTVRVDGPAMEPEYHTGQYLTFLPLTSDRPQRCDVVIYHPATDLNALYFKRVVALAGDTVSFSESGVMVNGKVPCPAVIHGNLEVGGTITHVESSQYFVVGDNLQESADSRVLGPVARSSIVGYLPG